MEQSHPSASDDSAEVFENEEWLRDSIKKARAVAQNGIDELGREAE